MFYNFRQPVLRYSPFTGLLQIPIGFLSYISKQILNMNPSETIVLQLITKGIDTDELFLHSGVIASNDGLEQIRPVILNLASEGYLTIKERNISLAGFHATLHSYKLTAKGEQQLEGTRVTLQKKWDHIKAAAVASNGSEQSLQEFRQLVAENQEWIYAMVMLEIASPQDAEAVLKAVTDNSDSSQRARDDRAQNILSESLTNLLGSHVRYD
jgi:hypothetical protein